MTYDNTNKGILGKNTRKTEERHPDITGSINIEGAEYWLNGWQKTNSRDGSKFYSLSVKPKEAQQSAPANAGGFTSGVSADDDIPF